MSNNFTMSSYDARGLGRSFLKRKASKALKIVKKAHVPLRASVKGAKVAGRVTVRGAKVAGRVTSRAIEKAIRVVVAPLVRKQIEKNPNAGKPQIKAAVLPTAMVSAGAVGAGFGPTGSGIAASLTPIVVNKLIDALYSKINRSVSVFPKTLRTLDSLKDKVSSLVSKSDDGDGDPASDSTGGGPINKKILIGAGVAGILGLAFVLMKKGKK